MVDVGLEFDVTVLGDLNKALVEFAKIQADIKTKLTNTGVGIKNLLKSFDGQITNVQTMKLFSTNLKDMVTLFKSLPDMKGINARFTSMGDAINVFIKGMLQNISKSTKASEAISSIGYTMTKFIDLVREFQGLTSVGNILDSSIKAVTAFKKFVEKFADIKFDTVFQIRGDLLRFDIQILTPLYEIAKRINKNKKVIENFTYDQNTKNKFKDITQFVVDAANMLKSVNNDVMSSSNVFELDKLKSVFSFLIKIASLMKTFSELGADANLGQKVSGTLKIVKEVFTELSTLFFGIEQNKNIFSTIQDYFEGGKKFSLQNIFGSINKYFSNKGVFSNITGNKIKNLKTFFETIKMLFETFSLFGSTQINKEAVIENFKSLSEILASFIGKSKLEKAYDFFSFVKEKKIGNLRDVKNNFLSLMFDGKNGLFSNFVVNKSVVERINAISSLKIEGISNFSKSMINFVSSLSEMAKIDIDVNQIRTAMAALTEVINVFTGKSRIEKLGMVVNTLEHRKIKSFTGAFSLIKEMFKPSVFDKLGNVGNLEGISMAINSFSRIIQAFSNFTKLNIDVQQIEVIKVAFRSFFEMFTGGKKFFVFKDSGILNFIKELGTKNTNNLLNFAKAMYRIAETFRVLGRIELNVQNIATMIKYVQLLGEKFKGIRGLDSKSLESFAKALNAISGNVKILDKKKGETEAIDYANTTVKAIKNVLKIKSPSKVAEEIGDNFSEGLKIGIETIGSKLGFLTNIFKNLQKNVNKIFSEESVKDFKKAEKLITKSLAIIGLVTVAVGAVITKELVTRGFGLVRKVLADLAPYARVVFAKVSEVVRNSARQIGNLFKNAFVGGFNYIINSFDKTKNAIMAFGNTTKNIFSGLGNFIKTPFMGLNDFIRRHLVITLNDVERIVRNIGRGIVGNFIQDEFEFTRVLKTIDIPTDEIENLHMTLRNLATDEESNLSGLENSLSTINEIAETAGTLGIEYTFLEDFVSVVGEMSIATNLANQEAATFFGQFGAITQNNEYRKIGSTLVNLGNNFATTEAIIADFSLRIAGAAEMAGFAEKDTLALSAALGAVGFNAEAGGSAMSRIINEMVAATAGFSEATVSTEVFIGQKQNAIAKLQEERIKFQRDLEGAEDRLNRASTISSENSALNSIDNAREKLAQIDSQINALNGSIEGVAGTTTVKVGGTMTKELAAFAKGAGVSAKEFADVFNSNPVAALNQFINGLGKLSSGDQLKILDELGLEGIRTSDALRRLAGAGELLNEAIEVANEGWEENIALTEEASKQNATARAGIQRLRNMIREISITIGSYLNTSIVKATGSFYDLFSSFNQFIKSGNVGETIQKIAEKITDFALSIVNFAIEFGKLVANIVANSPLLQNILTYANNIFNTIFNTINNITGLISGINQGFANMFGAPSSEDNENLQRYNELIEKRALYQEKLDLHGGQNTGMVGSKYKLEYGDTLSQIALDTGVALQDIFAANNLDWKSARTLLAGQEIIIPVRMATNVDENGNIIEGGSGLQNVIDEIDSELAALKPEGEGGFYSELENLANADFTAIFTTLQNNLGENLKIALSIFSNFVLPPPLGLGISLISMLTTAIENDLGGIRGKLEESGFIGETIVEISDAINDIFDGVANLITSGNVNGDFKFDVTNLFETPDKLIGNPNLYRKETKNPILLFLQSIKDSVSGAIEVIDGIDKEKLFAFLNTIKDAVVEIGSAAITGAIFVINNIVSPALSSIFNAFKNLVDNIDQDKLEKAKNLILGFLGGFVGLKLAPIAIGLFAIGAAISGFSNAATSIVNTAGTIWELIETIIKGDWENVGPKASEALDGIKNSVSAFFDGIAGFTFNFMEAIGLGEASELERNFRIAFEGIGAFVDDFFRRIHIAWLDLQIAIVGITNPEAASQMQKQREFLGLALEFGEKLRSGEITSIYDSLFAPGTLDTYNLFDVLMGNADFALSDSAKLSLKLMLPNWLEQVKTEGEATDIVSMMQLLGLDPSTIFTPEQLSELPFLKTLPTNLSEALERNILLNNLGGEGEDISGFLTLENIGELAKNAMSGFTRALFTNETPQLDEKTRSNLIEGAVSAIEQIDVNNELQTRLMESEIFSGFNILSLLAHNDTGKGYTKTLSELERTWVVEDLLTSMKPIADQFGTETATALYLSTITALLTNQEDAISDADANAIAQKFYNSLIDPITGQQFNIPTTVADGIYEGLNNSIINNQKYFGVGKTIGDEIQKGTEDSLDMKSPSGVFKGYGKNIIEGLEKGIDDNLSTLAKSVENIVRELETVAIMTAVMANRVAISLAGIVLGLVVFNSTFALSTTILKLNLLTMRSDLDLFIDKIEDAILALARMRLAFAVSGAGNNPNYGFQPTDKTSFYGGYTAKGEKHEVLENNLPFETYRTSKGKTYLISNENGQIYSPAKTRQVNAAAGVGMSRTEVNEGDVYITVNGSGNPEAVAEAVMKKLEKEKARGTMRTLRLSGASGV